MQRANGEQWEGVNVGLGLENILFILAFFKSGGLIELVRFNRFQTLETEPNRNFFVIF
jgi:hypothetical protein